MPDLQVQRVHPAQWALYRDLREVAVAETPAVFASSRAHEAERSPERWQALLGDGYTVAARLDGHCVGFATARAPRGAGARARGPGHGPPGSGRPGAVPPGVVQPGVVPAGVGQPGCEWTAILDEVWVEPAARGRRLPGPEGPTVADVLLLVLCGWARYQSRTRMSAVVPREASAMRRLVERHGFTPTGRRRALAGPVPRLGDDFACDLAAFGCRPSPRTRVTWARSS